MTDIVSSPTARRSRSSSCRGTYPLGAVLGAQYRSAYPHSVGFQLLDGHTAGCASRKVDPSNTAIGGLGLRGVYFGPEMHDADALIEGVTFTRLAGGRVAGNQLGAIGSFSQPPNHDAIRVTGNSGLPRAATAWRK